MANVATVSDETHRSVGREFQTTAQQTAKYLAPRTVNLIGRAHLGTVWPGMVLLTR